ncbi:MAG: arginine--tRNA ligase [Candidatus Moraniibacteriota bacterium]
MIGNMKLLLQKKIESVLQDLQETGALPQFVLPEIRVERPREEQFGEYTTNVALALSKLAKKNPMEIAELLQKKLTSDDFEKVEVVAPGYLNFYLSQKEISSVIEKILKEGKEYGASGMGQGVKVNNEFISANPTGPLHLGNARGGFYTDTLSSVLCKAGFDVTNEYYVNDAGEQVLKLGHSVLKDAEAVYAGDYIEQLAADNQETGVRETGEWAAKEVLENMIKKSVAEQMQVHFDIWTSEKKIIEDGFVDKALTVLKEKNLTFESEGALWLRTTEFGDDKDRVLVKQDGVKTYFASDAGYILNKMERGFTSFIETWGADHHGYINRFKAVAQALGFTGDIHFLIVQMVKVVKDGVEVRMSKRAGNVISVDELIETVGHDVARFFFLMYAPETHMNFDLGLAEERSQKNPVFYVQYAHARLCSILRKAEEEGMTLTQGDLSLLTHTKERELIRELMFFPELVETVAVDFSVHRLPQYAMKLADKFHSFYDACRVIDAENKEMTEARLQLVLATKVVLAETLALMGISAPEKM